MWCSGLNLPESSLAIWGVTFKKGVQSCLTHRVKVCDVLSWLAAGQRGARARPA